MTESAAETPYTETEALLAVMNGDQGRLEELTRSLLDGELAELRDQVDALRRALTTEAIRRRLNAKG
jgi:hypothetical protein